MRGERLYGGLVLVVFLVEMVALGDLAFVIAFGTRGAASAGIIARALIAALAVTMSALAILTAHTLGSEALVAARARRRKAQLPAWRDRWIALIEGTEVSPRLPLPEVAVEALLEVREMVIGPEQQRLDELAERLGVVDSLVPALRSRRRADRLVALELLAKARLAGAFKPLLQSLADAELSFRPMTARALARTLAAMPAGPDRDRRAAALAEGLAASLLPRGILEETLLLLDEVADPVVAHLLRPGTARAPQLAAAGAVGALRLVQLVDALGPLLVAADRALRTAGFRALAQIGVGAPAHGPAIVTAMNDEDEGVRVEACAAAGHLPAATSSEGLWARLGDRSWAVRLAAAEAMLAQGADGQERLREAARAHPDRFGRDMAGQVLRDAEVHTPLKVAA